MENMQYCHCYNYRIVLKGNVFQLFKQNDTWKENWQFLLQKCQYKILYISKCSFSSLGHKIYVDFDHISWLTHIPLEPYFLDGFVGIFVLMNVSIQKTFISDRYSALLEKLWNFLWLLQIKWSKKKKADGAQVLSISVWGKKPFHVILVVCVASNMWGNYIAVEQAKMGILIFKSWFTRTLKI